MSTLRRSLYLLVVGALVALLAACNFPRIGSTPISTPTPGITEHVTIEHDENGATLVLLPVTIEGHGPYTFALDTGASTSLIAASLARQLGLPQKGGPQQISGIGGTQQAIPVQIEHWSTGQIRLPQAIIASAALPGERHNNALQGLIGSDIWSQFGTVTVDYRDSTITVPRQIAEAPGPFIVDQAAFRSLPQAA